MGESKVWSSAYVLTARNHRAPAWCARLSLPQLRWVIDWVGGCVSGWAFRCAGVGVAYEGLGVAYEGFGAACEVMRA